MSQPTQRRRWEKIIIRNFIISLAIPSSLPESWVTAKLWKHYHFRISAPQRRMNFLCAVHCSVSSETFLVAELWIFHLQPACRRTTTTKWMDAMKSWSWSEFAPRWFWGATRKTGAEKQLHFMNIREEEITMMMMIMPKMGRMSDLLSGRPTPPIVPGVTNSNTMNFWEQLWSNSRITLSRMMNYYCRVAQGKQRTFLGSLSSINTRISTRSPLQVR